MRLVSDEPFKLDRQLEQLLLRFKRYTEDNFGCLIEFHTLCTIEGHTSFQLTLRHFAALVEAETTFSIVCEELVALLKETKDTSSAFAPPLPTLYADTTLIFISLSLVYSVYHY